jgi:hypothetical protein
MLVAQIDPPHLQLLLLAMDSDQMVFPTSLLNLHPPAIQAAKLFVVGPHCLILMHELVLDIVCML